MNNEEHIGYFRVVDKKTRQIIARYDYDKITAKERRRLRDEKGIILYCDCIKENYIELKISSSLVIYPLKNNTGERHNPACPRYKSADSRDWSYDSVTKTFKASSYNTAELFVRKLNMLAFQDAMYVDRFASIEGVKKASRKLSTNSGIRLNSLFNPSKFERNKEYFVYMFLGRVEGVENNLIKITCLQKFDDESPVTLHANPSVFNEYFKESQNFVIGEKNKLPLLIGGWVYLDDDNKLILTDFWLRATGKNGRLFF